MAWADRKEGERINSYSYAVDGPQTENKDIQSGETGTLSTVQDTHSSVKSMKRSITNAPAAGPMRLCEFRLRVEAGWVFSVRVCIRNCGEIIRKFESMWLGARKI